MPAETVQDAIRNVVELDWYADNDTVTVTPRDQKRFDIQKDLAIEVLQAEGQAGLFGKQLGLLLERLAFWISNNLSSIGDAFLTVQDGSFSFVVIQKVPECDDDLQDSLASLNFAIANDPDLDLIELDTIALPPVSEHALTSFIDRKFAMKYVHGKRS